MPNLKNVIASFEAVENEKSDLTVIHAPDNFWNVQIFSVIYYRIIEWFAYHINNICRSIRATNFSIYFAIYGITPSFLIKQC